VPARKRGRPGIRQNENPARADANLKKAECRKPLGVLPLCYGTDALGFRAMRLNVWVILAALLALLVIIRYIQQRETLAICVDDPTASVCHR
jgi:hypothetical protein